MKFILHKKIAAWFGYEFIRINRNVYQNINSHLQKLFEDLRINCVLDVGANMGQYTFGIRQGGYRGHIISFEPVGHCYENLCKQQTDTWKIVNYALGEKNGMTSINVMNKDVFSSILSPNEYSGERFKDSARVSHVEKIGINKLDDVLDDLILHIREPRIFMKLDTQGYDLQVLKGAEKSLRYISGLQSEISCRAIYDGMPTHIDSLAFIDRLGYQITNLFPLSHDKVDMSLLEFDCVFRKKNTLKFNS